MIGIGVIGCGHWGPNHIRNFQANRRSHVLAFAEKDTDRRQKICELFPQIKALENYHPILNNPEIQAVVVATPTATHHRIVKECLENDKDVLCEKPLTITEAESEELVELARQHDRILMVGHTFLYNNGIRRLKDYIKQGEIGTPLYIHLRRTNLGPIRQDVNAVYDLASHDVYIANFLLDREPVKAIATGADYLQPGIEDVAFITLKYHPTAMAHIHVSWLDPKKERRITVIGDRKMIVWDDLSTETIKIYNKSVAIDNNDYNSFGQFHLILKEGDVVIPKIQLNEPLANQTDHFLDCVIGRNQPLTSGEDGLSVVRTLEAIQQSMRQNA